MTSPSWPSRLERFLELLHEDERYSHTAEVSVAIEGEVLVQRVMVDRRPRDVFSVTKTVVGLLAGAAAGDGLLPHLDTPAHEVLPFAVPAHARRQTLRHLLTMARGAEPGGVFDLDEVASRSEPWGPQFAQAPQRHAPGAGFVYDNGGVHLLACVLQHVTGDLLTYAEDRLFAPLGIDEWSWSSDPEGVPVGPAHLAMTADGLLALGHLMLDAGRAPDGTQLVPAQWLRFMRRPSSSGGPPEHVPYGALLWLESDVTFFAAGWSGALLLVQAEAALVVAVTTEPHFGYGPPPVARLRPDWRPPLMLVRQVLLSPDDGGPAA